MGVCGVAWGQRVDKRVLRNGSKEPPRNGVWGAGSSSLHPNVHHQTGPPLDLSLSCACSFMSPMSPDGALSGSLGTPRRSLHPSQLSPCVLNIQRMSGARPMALFLSHLPDVDPPKEGSNSFYF